MIQRPGSSIFRSEALEHYIQSREKSVLPHIARPPVLLGLWVLLGLCMAALFLAYFGQVPVYISGSGVVLEREAVVVVFLPTTPTHPLHIRAGAPVLLQITPIQTIKSTIDRVETGVFNPADARKRYGLGDTCSRIITGPSVIASVKLDATFPSGSYTGSVIAVEVQVSTTHVLSLLLGSAA